MSRGGASGGSRGGGGGGGMGAGMATFWRCNKAGAIPHFTQHLKSNPRDFNCWLFRGISYSVIGQNQNAQSDYQQAARIGNECEKLVANSFLQINPADSLRLLKEATQKYPRDGTGWFWYAAGGSKNTAAERIAALKKCIDLNYKYAHECHFQIGMMLADQEKHQEAIQRFQTSLSGNPDRTFCHIQLGFSLLKTGHIDTAKQHFEKATTLNPVLTDANLGLSKVYEQQGDLQAAHKHLEIWQRSREDNKYELVPPHGKTQVDLEYASGVHIGPLNFLENEDGKCTEEFNSFLGGRYVRTTAINATIKLNRRHGGKASDDGQYWTVEHYESGELFRIDLAVPRKWNDGSKSTSIEVPRGIYLYEGYAAPQKTDMEDRIGGGWQVFIPFKILKHIISANNDTLNWDFHIGKAMAEQEEFERKFHISAFKLEKERQK